MMKVVLLLSGLWILGHCSAWADNPPRGALLELHSCELYAGGCVVSSEATQGGRYMLRIWSFTGGQSSEVDFAGLQVALLQVSPDNLASPDSAPGQGVVYLPERASSGQRAALLTWLKGTVPELKTLTLDTRTVPLHLIKAKRGYEFTAGHFLSVKTASLESCPTGACGEALWYKPRTPGTIFTVALNRSSYVSEPWLKLRWEDAGKKSIFLAKFGENTGRDNLFVSSSDLCGPDSGLF